MATEIVKGLIRATLKTKNDNFTSNFFISLDEDGDYRVSFAADQNEHENADGDVIQFFDLDGLRELAEFLDEVINEIEETN